MVRAVLRAIPVPPWVCVGAFMWLVLFTAPVFPGRKSFGFYSVEWSFFFFVAFLMYATALTLLVRGLPPLVWDGVYGWLIAFVVLGVISSLDAQKMLRALIYVGQYMPYFFLLALVITVVDSRARIETLAVWMRRLMAVFLALFAALYFVFQQRSLLNRFMLDTVNIDVLKVLTYVELPAAVLLYQLVAERFRWWRLALAGLLALGIVFTGSRGSLAVLAGMTGLAVLKGGRMRQRLVVILVMLTVVAVGLGTSKYTWQRVSQTVVTSGEEFDDRVTAFSRVYTALIAWQLIVEHPVNGVGIGNLSLHTEMVVRQLRLPAAILAYWEDHVIFETTSTPLRLGAEVGVAGIAFFVAFYAYLWRRVRRALRHGDPSLRVLLTSAEIYIITAFVHNFIDLGFSNYYSWFYYGLCIAMCRVALRDAREAPAASAGEAGGIAWPAPATAS